MLKSFVATKHKLFYFPKKQHVRVLNLRSLYRSTFVVADVAGSKKNIVSGDENAKQEMYLGIGKYYKIEVVNNDQELLNTPLISKGDVEAGTKVENMLEKLKPGESMELLACKKSLVWVL